MKMKKIAFVDLDNISFFHSHMDISKLIQRLEAIESLMCNKVRFYCNKNTKHFIEKEQITLSTSPIVLKTKKDAADHKIIHDAHQTYKKGKFDTIYIISNDKTLLRLSKFIVPNDDNLILYQFRNTKLININSSINICFKKKVDLEHFIESYNLLKQRYLLS